MTGSLAGRLLVWLGLAGLAFCALRAVLAPLHLTA